MEVTQTYPADYLGKQKVTVFEDKVVIYYKNLLRENTIEYAYSEIREKTVKSRYGDTAWTTLGWNIFLIVFVASITLSLIFPEAIRSPIFILVAVILIVMSLISFAMRFVKFDTVKYFDKEIYFLFEIKINDKNRQQAQEVINFIEDKLKQQS